MEVFANFEEKRSWLEIDLSQIAKNYEVLKKTFSKDVKIISVIKADAYGHGDSRVAMVLEKSGCDFFAVSNIDEAIGLRNAGVSSKILILGYTSPMHFSIIKEYDLSQTIISREYANILEKSKFKIKCHVAIDTGMNRIGLDADHSEDVIKVIRNLSHKQIVEGIFTHLCDADTFDEQSIIFTQEQIQKFSKIAAGLSDLKLPFIHFYNSAGALNHMLNKGDEISDHLRLGIVLYGLKPNNCMKLPSGIKPALKWKSVVSMVKNVCPGEVVGYGRTYKVKKETRIATITTGYADGFSRLLSNKGHVIINNCNAPVVGRVCMDQILVDVTEIQDVKMGDIVTILDDKYTADDMAQEIGSIGYEVVCNINKRVQRFYI